MSSAKLSKIRIYPIKSLDFIELEQAKIGKFSLEYDRQFAILTKDGRYVNGKRTGKVNQLHAQYKLEDKTVTLSDRGAGSAQTFELAENNPRLLEYLSNFFNMDVILKCSIHGELMDMPKTASTSVVSKASLLSLQQDFHHHSLEDLRLRFRANLEFDGVEAFWEEGLFEAPGTGVHFKVGDVEMIGISPRARCNVPPRDPFTGETDKTFVKTMLNSRAHSLPKNSLLPQFGNLYHLTVNTYLPLEQEGKYLQLGDSVTLLDKIKLQAN